MNQREVVLLFKQIARYLIMDFKLLSVILYFYIATNNLYDYSPIYGLDFSVRAGRKGNLNILAISLII